MKSIQLRAAFGAAAMAAILTGTVFVYGAETDIGVATQEKEAYDSTREGGNLAQASGTANANNNPVNRPTTSLINRSAADTGVNANTNAITNANANANLGSQANNDNANMNTQTGASANNAFDRANTAAQSKTGSMNRAGQDAANDWNQPLNARVESALVSNAQLAGTDVDVNEKNGEVTLKGKVRTEAQKQAAEQAVRSINGVNNVKNKIKVDANFNATGAI